VFIEQLNSSCPILLRKRLRGIPQLLLTLQAMITALLKRRMQRFLCSFPIGELLPAVRSTPEIEESLNIHDDISEVDDAIKFLSDLSESSSTGSPAEGRRIHVS
jgi:hypothetical protein